MHMLCTNPPDAAQHLCGPISFPNPLIHFAGVHTQGALEESWHLCPTPACQGKGGADILPVADNYPGWIQPGQG